MRREPPRELERPYHLGAEPEAFLLSLAVLLPTLEIAFSKLELALFSS
jgi:hypothetical protein